jgi:hypothetical protein
MWQISNRKSAIKIENGSDGPMWPIITALQDVSETKGVSCLAPKCHKALSHSNQDI